MRDKAIIQDQDRNLETNYPALISGQTFQSGITSATQMALASQPTWCRLSPNFALNLRTELALFLGLCPHGAGKGDSKKGKLLTLRKHSLAAS